MKLNLPQKLTLGFYILLVIFWLGLFFTGTTEGPYNYFYSFLFGLIPLVGGLVAMFSAGTWGGLKTAIGKAVFFIGLGIFLWGCGEMIWSYYNFFRNEPAPYPGLSDIGFAPSIFFYGLGAAYLSKVTGARFGLRSSAAKFFVIIAPLLILAVSYYVLVVIARGGVIVPEGESLLKIFFDIVYPLGDYLALAIAVTIAGLSAKYMGGRYTIDIISVWLGLAVMFAGDASFSYTTTVGTFYNANWGDLLLTTGLFLLAFGVLGFSKLKES